MLPGSRWIARRNCEGARREPSSAVLRSFTTAVDGTCWLVTEADGRPIGTITLEFTADPSWLPSDDPDNALYVHRMVVDDGFLGRELGSALLDWAARRARKTGRS
ncbi:MAG: GNAT family N-acetyltransferase [Pseudonocardiaceae bacterium]